MTDDDRVIADKHLLDDQAHDALALEDVQRVGGHTQPREERRERLREAQVRRALSGLFGEGVQLGAQRLLALAKGWHALAQLLQRQELLLIGGEQPLDALAHAHQLTLHRLLTLFRRVGRARGRESAIKLLFDQRGILEQPNHLGPHDLIQQVLPDGSVLADGTAEVPPAIRAKAAIVVNRASARTSRGARERIPALAATHQALHELGSIVRRRARTLFSCSSSCARANVSSAMSAGTGISIHSSRGRS